MLDYIVAIALFFAPKIFGFENVGGAAVALPMILGVGLFVYSLLTKYELGVFKVLNFRYHLVIDIIASVLLILSPFLFGFINEAPNAWLPHIAVGIAVILVVIFTKPVPGADATTY
jgi:hypothetical protein